MYNFDGIYFAMKGDCGILITVGIIILVCTLLESGAKKKKLDLVIGSICILLAISSVVYHVYILKKPQVLIHEGYFFSEHRDNPYLLRNEYAFTNGNELKPIFYLDVYSKKKIYPEDFDKEIKYRIYYEKETDIIVKVEVVDEEMNKQDNSCKSS